MEPVEWTDMMHEAPALRFEHLPGRLFRVALDLGTDSAFIE